MEAELAPVLAADVEQWLEDHPNDALCVAIDGFERIQSTTLAEDIQKYLADWCGILTDPDGRSPDALAACCSGEIRTVGMSFTTRNGRRESVNTALADSKRRRVAWH